MQLDQNYQGQFHWGIPMRIVEELNDIISDIKIGDRLFLMVLMPI